MPVVHYKASKL